MDEKTLYDRLSRSEVRKEDDGLALVHHATRNEVFDPREIAPFSHFGTRAAAAERIGERGSARLISAFLVIENPIYIPDVNDNHSLKHFVELISAYEPAAFIPEHRLNHALEVEQETGEGFEYLADLLLEHGFDGFGYRNRHEDPGSMSWVILRADQIHVVFDGPMLESKSPWELTEKEFIGPAFIAGHFEVNGHDEDYGFIWEAMNHQDENYPIVATRGGWKVKWLMDCEPMTFGLIDPKGEPKGFYSGGASWIEPCDRGKGLSKLMIEAAADILGGCPCQNQHGLGFSKAGYQAHVSAYRQIVEEAEERGYITAKQLTRTGAARIFEPSP